MANRGGRRRSGVEARGEGVEKAVSSALIRDDGKSDRKHEAMRDIRGGTGARDTHRARQWGARATVGVVTHALFLRLVLHLVIIVRELR
eukprot:6941568-Heterocapsa_arctica.AAC.1